MQGINGFYSLNKIIGGKIMLNTNIFTYGYGLKLGYISTTYYS